jgi:NADH dehydrogenase FAD-containing subunit
VPQADLRKIYPTIDDDDVRIRVIELQDHILSTYDRDISEYTMREFGRCARPRHIADGTIALR